MVVVRCSYHIVEEHALYEYHLSYHACCSTPHTTAVEVRRGLRSNSISVVLKLENCFQRWQEDWYAFNVGVDLCFLADLAARFLTAYHDDYANRIVYEPTMIARHYCSGLLVPDLIASVPLTIVSRRPRTKALIFSLVAGHDHVTLVLLLLYSSTNEARD